MTGGKNSSKIILLWTSLECLWSENDFNSKKEDYVLINVKLKKDKIFYCFCLIHGFSLLALLQQPLRLLNSGQSKQVVTSWFSMKSCLPLVCVKRPRVQNVFWE